jgi:hypothetical protein
VVLELGFQSAKSPLTTALATSSSITPGRLEVLRRLPADTGLWLHFTGGHPQKTCQASPWPDELVRRSRIRSDDTGRRRRARFLGELLTGGPSLPSAMTQRARQRIEDPEKASVLLTSRGLADPGVEERRSAGRALRGIDAAEARLARDFASRGVVAKAPDKPERYIGTTHERP